MEFIIAFHIIIDPGKSVGIDRDVDSGYYRAVEDREERGEGGLGVQGLEV